MGVASHGETTATLLCALILPRVAINLLSTLSHHCTSHQYMARSRYQDTILNVMGVISYASFLVLDVILSCNINVATGLMWIEVE